MAWKISQGAQDNSSDLPLNALGNALSVEQSTPVAQLAFDSGATEKAFQYQSGGGSSDINANRIAEASCSAAIASKSHTLTKRFAVNRPGAGIECKIEARFDSPVTGTRQIAGMFGPTDELGFGYDTDGSFGIFRKHGGATYIHQFTITGGTSSGNCTVTLDGTGFVTTPGAGLTTDQTASELARLVDAQTEDWHLYAIGSVLYAASYEAYTPSGGFSVSGAGVTDTNGTEQAGTAPTVVFVAQANWNLKPGFVVTPGNLTPYRIAAQFSGGAIVFQIADQYSGILESVHAIQYPGTSTDPVVKNPHFRAGIGAENVSGSSAVTVRATSMQLATQGKNLFDGESRVSVNSIASVNTSALNLLTIKNSPVVVDRSHCEALLKSAVATCESSGNATIYAIKNAVFTEPLVWESYAAFGDSNILLALNSAAADITQGEFIDAMVFIDDSELMNLSEMQQYLAPGETLSLIGLVASGPVGMSATVKWFEDY